MGGFWCGCREIEELKEIFGCRKNQKCHHRLIWWFFWGYVTYLIVAENPLAWLPWIRSARSRTPRVVSVPREFTGETPRSGNKPSDADYCEANNLKAGEYVCLDTQVLNPDEQHHNCIKKERMIRLKQKENPENDVEKAFIRHKTRW